MVSGVRRKSRRYRSACTRTHFSWLRFGTAYKSGTQEAQYFYSLPERSKLRSMLANQDDKGSLQKTHWRSSTSSRKVWWLDNSRSQSPRWRRWISKQSPIRSRGTRSSHSMDSILSVQNKNFSGDGKEFTKVSRADGKAKSHSHWQFVGIWQILWRSVMESSNFDTSSIWDEWYCWKSGTQNKKKGRLLYCCIQAWMKNGGLILWNAVSICEMFKTSWQMGKLLMKADSENHLKAQWFLWSNGWISSDFFTRPVKAPPIWQESFTWNVPRICIHRGEEFGKEISGRRHSGIGKHGRVRNLLSKNQCKKSIDATKGEDFIFPVADGTAKLSGRDHECREPALSAEQPVEVKISVENFKANRKGFNRQKQKMTLKPGKTSGRSKVTSSIVITLNLEFNSVCRKKKHSQFHWNTLMWPGLLVLKNLDVLQEKRVDDHWNVDANRSLSDSWKGFTKFTLLKEKSPKVYMWSGGD